MSFRSTRPSCKRPPHIPKHFQSSKTRHREKPEAFYRLLQHASYGPCLEISHDLEMSLEEPDDKPRCSFSFSTLLPRISCRWFPLCVQIIKTQIDEISSELLQALATKSLVMPAPSISNDGSKVRILWCPAQYFTGFFCVGH